MLICPACGFQSDYFQGLRVGTLRGCSRCGLFSLLHLCNKCQTISLKRSGSALCACGEEEIIQINSIDDSALKVALYVGVGSFLFITVGRWIEAGKPRFGREGEFYIPLVKFVFSEYRIFDYCFAALVNGGVAWVISIILLRVMGRKFSKELA